MIWSIIREELKSQFEGLRFVLWSIGLPRALNQELSRPSREKSFFPFRRSGRRFWESFLSASTQLNSALIREPANPRTESALCMTLDDL